MKNRWRNFFFTVTPWKAGTLNRTTSPRFGVHRVKIRRACDAQSSYWVFALFAFVIQEVDIELVRHSPHWIRGHIFLV